MRNVREQPRSFVHSPAALPAFHSTIQTSESPDKGRLCPPIWWLHPALLLPLPPILLFSPSCCASSASFFSLTATCPRIAQQVPSENRAGDVGRVKLSLFYHPSFFFFFTEYLLFPNKISRREQQERVRPITQHRRSLLM